MTATAEAMDGPAPAGAIAPAQRPTYSSKSTSRGRSHIRNVVALMLREMSSRYGNRPGGYIWAVLEPLSMILMLSVAFSLLLRSPSLGDSFIMFYATGFLPFIMFRNIAKNVQAGLDFSRALMIYPLVKWIDAVIARLVLNALTTLLVSFLLLSGVLIFEDYLPILRFGPMVEAYLMCAAIGFGIGMINCVMVGFFPIWSSLWAVVMRPLAIASGVILLYENLPFWVQNILWYNPLLHALGLMRKGFYPTYDASYVSHIYVCTVAMALITLGLILMRRYHPELLSR